MNAPAVDRAVDAAKGALGIEVATELPDAIVDTFMVHTAPEAVRDALADLIRASDINAFMVLLRAVAK